MSTDDPNQDFIFAITHAAVRLFALWLAITSLSGLIYAIGIFLSNNSFDGFSDLTFIHYGLYIACAYVMWYLAPDLAAKVLPKGHRSAPKTDPLNLLALILAGIGTYLMVWSIPVLLSIFARLLWSFGVDTPPGPKLWAYDGFIEHLMRIGVGLWLIRARFPVAQWLLKLRRIHAD